MIPATARAPGVTQGNRPVPSTRHSHSGLEAFANCPHSYYRQRVLRDCQQEQGDAALWGDHIHKSIETWLETPAAQRGELPSALHPYRDLVLRAAKLTGEPFVECLMAVTRDWTVCDYTDRRAYFRGKIDYVLNRGDSALVLDWKTGKSRYGTKDQDARYAAMVFVTLPDVQTVGTRWVYLAENKVVRRDFDRSQLPELRALVDGPVAEIEMAHRTNNWAKRPSGLCKLFCPVIDCEFHGRGA